MLVMLVVQVFMVGLGPKQPSAFALTLSTKAFTPTLHQMHQHSSSNVWRPCRTYLSCARVAKPVSTGTGVPEGSWEFSRGAMAMRAALVDYRKL